MRERNQRSAPRLTLVIIEGDYGTHIAVPAGGQSQLSAPLRRTAGVRAEVTGGAYHVGW